MYCSQCGVEVEDSVEQCPLCQSPIQKFHSQEPVKPYPEKAAGSPPLPPLTVGEKMAIARTITTLCFLIPIFLVITIDYLLNKRITWSAYVTQSLVAAWVISIVCLFSWMRFYLLTSLIHIDLFVFLSALSLRMGHTSWLLPVALPILISSDLIITGIIFITRRIKNKGSNVAGVILLGIACLCGMIDLVLALHLPSFDKLSWSLIVFSVMLPTAALMFYLQSARFRHSKIRRILHF